MRVAIAGAAALTAEGHVMNLGDEAIAETLAAAVLQHACVSQVVLRSTCGSPAGRRRPGDSARGRSSLSSARWPAPMRC